MPGSSNSQAQQVAPLLALATQLLRAGRPDDAIVPLRQAALLQPADHIIQHDLGLACLEVGRIPDVIEALQRAAPTPTNQTSRPALSPAVKALKVAWLQKKKQIFAGKLSKPDAEDPETVNHLNWYLARGYAALSGRENGSFPRRMYQAGTQKR